jgi:hypothetical protein
MGKAQATNAQRRRIVLLVPRQIAIEQRICRPTLAAEFDRRTQRARHGRRSHAAAVASRVCRSWHAHLRFDSKASIERPARSNDELRAEASMAALPVPAARGAPWRTRRRHTTRRAAAAVARPCMPRSLRTAT